MKKEKIYAVEEFMDQCPTEDPYQPCPCGCGSKFRYVMKGGNKELDIHYKRFVTQLKFIHGEENVVDNNSYKVEDDEK